MLSTPLKVLMATVGLLLLLACANLAGLLLARGASASTKCRARLSRRSSHALARQTLTESLLLARLEARSVSLSAYFSIEGLVRVFASGRFISRFADTLEMLKTPTRP